MCMLAAMFDDLLQMTCGARGVGDLACCSVD